MATKKKSKKKSKKSKSKALKNFKVTALLRILCIIITTLDMVHSLYFVIQATYSCSSYLNVYSILSLMASIGWVLIVLMCLVGLIKRRPSLVNPWLLFSVLGFFTDIIFFFCGLYSALPLGWMCMKRLIVVFIGIAVEFLCIYCVYSYYLIMDPCRKVHTVNKKGKKSKKTKTLDKKGCKELKKSRKKSESKKKRKR